MHSVSSRFQAVFGFFTTVGMTVGLLVALSTSLFPADVRSNIELTGVKVREEYAQIRFDLDADLSSLFNWNTKQVFLYVLVSYPSSIPGSNTTSEAIIWDYIIPAKPSPFSLTALKEKYSSSDKKSTTRPGKKSIKKKTKTGRANTQKHGVLRLRNQRPKYYLTDITHALSKRENASLVVGWNVQPWVGPLMWNAQSKTAKNVGDKTIYNLGFVTAGKGGAESEKFHFPELPEKKREREAKEREAKERQAREQEARERNVREQEAEEQERLGQRTEESEVYDQELPQREQSPAAEESLE